jgi:prepilin-type N-terminal cleavage/methylation domain-containing protein
MKKAFTLVEILIVVSIIALLATIGIPAILGSRTAADEKMKEVNVSTINAAKDQWSILYNKPVGTTVYWTDIEDFVGGGITNITDLTIGGDTININKIGYPASY